MKSKLSILAMAAAIAAPFSAFGQAMLSPKQSYRLKGTTADAAAIAKAEAKRLRKQQKRLANAAV